MEMDKQRMDMFINYEDEEKNDFDEEYKEQFRQMTDEEIERHIGLEKVRNVMEGFDGERGIDKIRRIVAEVRNEKTPTCNLHYDGLTMKQRNEIEEKQIENNTFDF